jgi:hypothetical protein
VTGKVDPRLLDTTWQVEFGRTAAYGSTTPPQRTVGASTIGSAHVSTVLSGLRPSSTYHYHLVAANALGSAPGGDMTFTTAADRTGPALALRVARRQTMRDARTLGVKLGASCSEPCQGTAELRLAKGVARGLHLPVVLGTVRVSLGKAGSHRTIRLRLGKRQAQALARLRKLNAVILVKVADEAGNHGTAKRPLSLR